MIFLPSSFYGEIKMLWNPSIELFCTCSDETRSPSWHVLGHIAVAIEELLAVVLEEGNGILWFLY